MSDEVTANPVIPVTPDVNPPAIPDAELPGTITVWYKNGVLWTNAVTALVLILTTYCGVTVPTELQVSIMTVINIALQAPKMAPTKAKALARNMAIRARMFRKA